MHSSSKQSTRMTSLLKYVPYRVHHPYRTLSICGRDTRGAKKFLSGVSLGYVGASGYPMDKRELRGSAVFLSPCVLFLPRLRCSKVGKTQNSKALTRRKVFLCRVRLSNDMWYHFCTSGLPRGVSALLVITMPPKNLPNS